MGVRANCAVSKLSPGDSPRGHAAPPISSLNEAWLHALEKCAIDNPLTETILPLSATASSVGVARGSVAAEGSWRPAGCRYCRLPHRRAAVATPKASHARHEPGVGNSATFVRTLRINQ
jgi:hypothetical protein